MLITSGAERAIYAPADGTVVGSIREATLDDITHAVAAARRSLDDWRRAAPYDRAAVLSRAAALLENRAEELGLLHARESGKVITQARKEIFGAAALLDENAHIGRFDAGYLAPTGALPGGERDLTLVERVPLGVVACVIPFNFPVELTIEKAGAALAAGNTVVVKPPPQNPLATIATVQALIDAGLPEGVLTVLPGGREVSAALCAAPGVDAVSLTGSVGAGVAVAQATAHMLRPLHLELGGNGAAVVFDDADVDLVVSETLRGRMLMNGQACAATKRLVVHRSVVTEVVERLEAVLAAITVGDPTDESSEVGPLIDARSASRVAAQVSKAVSQGATLVRGEMSARDAWYPPALLRSVPAGADVAVDDEIFGPVVTTIPFDTDEESIEIVNSSQLALTAAIFSGDLERALAAAQRFEVGGVVVNGTNNYRPPVVPFGGVGLAGTGREGIGYTYEDLTRTRFIAVRGVRPPGVPLGGSADG
ncbi:MAG: aldehyde dehydrogenase family protein [Gammaproteobacteria bacterium]|nr:aldehyde dehydrogenase family protein [Gammaproteobacteria bacterium]